MAKSTGLIDQLQRQSDRDLSKRTQSREGRAGGQGGPPYQRGRQQTRNADPQLARRERRNSEGTGHRSNGRRSPGKGGAYRVLGRRTRSERRAGGKGERRALDSNRLMLISKKLSMICSHIAEVRRRGNGLIAWREFVGFFRRRGTAIYK